MDQMGVYFVGFVSQYGYDRVLSVLGRHMRDFLNGLDNLHEYLKFSYPRMRAPSFICENETRQGLTLHYRSKRRGFVYYAMGQIREVSYFIINHDNIHSNLKRNPLTARDSNFQKTAKIYLHKYSYFKRQNFRKTFKKYYLNE